MNHETTRRRFLQRGSEVAAVTAVVSTMGGVHSEAAVQKDIVQLGIIGCGGIMTHHVKGLAENRPGVSIAWFCDVDSAQIDKIAPHYAAAQRAAPKRTSRYEDVLSDKNVDAVIVATPHHWHAPIALRAMQEGKDVYLEKPISHVYNEGLLVSQAARKYGRIVQQGSQMRSSKVTEKAARLMKQGILGEVKVARAWTAELRRVVRPVPDSATPSTVNYDRWLGPAPSRGFNRHRFHGTWRLFQDYGNGEIGDDGIHDLDMACWGLGVDTVPSQITARGGRMLLHGHASEYPDNLCVNYEYPDGRLLIYENYPFTSYGLHGFDNGNVFYGTEGYMIFSRRGAFSVFLGPKSKPGPTEGRDIRGQRGYKEHMEDFLNSVRTRKPNRIPPEVAHRSCALVHLGEIAYRTDGRLDFDVKAQRFTNSESANALLTKEYRDPFVLPELG